jgi:hypothetical protein
MLFLAVAVVTAAPSFAQVSATTSVSGTVSDQTGAVVVGAEITLTDTSTNTSQTTTSNDVGRYIFPVVGPGVYNLSVNKTNFRVAKVDNQTVLVSTPLTLNVTLTPGAATETVEVTATGTVLQTTNATVGTVVERQELLTMPNLSRDVSSLVTLQPGITTSGNSAGEASDQNSFILDGGTITDDMSGNNNTYIPSFAAAVNGMGTMGGAPTGAAPSGILPTPTDTIEEFKTSSTGQTADYNGAGGSETVMATKKGTNDLHGSAYDFYNDARFGGADSWDNNHKGIGIPAGHYDRFGVDAGGPITRKKFLGGEWFVFGGYEGFRDPTSETFERNYPTPLMRSGMMFVNNMIVNLNNFAVPVPAGMSAKVYSTIGAGVGTMIPGQSAYCGQPGGCGLVPFGGTATGSSGTLDPRNLGLNPEICTGGATNGGACSAGLWHDVPLPNDYTSGDIGNSAGYIGTLAIPQSSNFGVLRIDHDFSSKWHFDATYHYYNLQRVVSNQVDVSGILEGGSPATPTFGYNSASSRPQIPWLYTAQLSTNITNYVTNELTYSGTRNWWAYNTDGSIPDMAGFPAAFEPGGETSGDFAPFNTDNADTRFRYWNGHDDVINDNLTWIKGNHLMSIGGMYERNNMAHLRNDNGGTINTFEQYLMGEGTTTSFSAMGIDGSAYTPQVGGTDVVTSNRYADYYCMITGMVCEAQQLFTRQVGPKSTATSGGLPLNTISSCASSTILTSSLCQNTPPALEQSIVPTYNLYFTDSWHIRPTLTLTYGLGYTVEMPPFNAAGAQDVLVDQNNNPINMADYMNARNAAALQGQAYDPLVGFSTINNVNGSPKYPYNPFYGGFSPRVALAWNPNFDSGPLGSIFGHGETVVRGSWSRIYGRLNGVDNILIPILAPGLMQTAVCNGPNLSGGCGSTPATNFRVGVDGTVAPLPQPSVAGLPNNALPQPWFPGFNDVGTGEGATLDPNFRPNRSDEFNLSIERQLGRKVQIEVGYIGRIIRNEFQEYDINAIPFNMTLGGESFAQAWGNIMTQTDFGANQADAQVQPFFEAALGQTPGAFAPGGYCAGFTSCTAAFVKQEAGNMGCSCAWDAWTDLSTGLGTPSGKPAWAFGRTMLNDPITNTAPGIPASIGANGQTTDIIPNGSNGWGNYNAAYITISFSDWHGLTLRQNLTWSRALGTGSVVQATGSFTEPNPYNLADDYGIQAFNQPLNYNLYFHYDLPFFRNQNSWAGKVLGGWAITPIFVAYSGAPLEVNTSNGDAEAFGESDTAFVGGFENGVIIGNLNYSNSRKQGVFGSGGVGTSGTTGQNIFTNPQQAFQQFRDPILGVDGDISSFPLYGLPVWNLDATLTKDFKITERFDFEFYMAAQNVLNHMQPNNPSFNLGNPTTFGVLGGGGNVQASVPRNLQFGLRATF